VEQWRAIEQAMKEKPAAACVFEEPDLIERTVRDFLTDEIDEVVCDDEPSAQADDRGRQPDFQALRFTHSLLRGAAADLLKNSVCRSRSTTLSIGRSGSLAAATS
jgi:hypothetical protein